MTVLESTSATLVGRELQRQWVVQMAEDGLMNYHGYVRARGLWSNLMTGY